MADWGTKEFSKPVATSEFVRAFETAQRGMWKINQDKGFDTEYDKINFGEKIALAHGELSEALEYYRKGNQLSDHIPAFLGIEEELADTVIRCMNLASAFGLRLADAIVAKSEFNSNRPYLHGGKRF
jgi:NTP pyrophosphatase (non-canonical NTP hydrolase)